MCTAAGMSIVTLYDALKACFQPPLAEIDKMTYFVQLQFELTACAPKTDQSAHTTPFERQMEHSMSGTRENEGIMVIFVKLKVHRFSLVWILFHM